jgi:hypothetical protein
MTIYDLRRLLRLSDAVTFAQAGKQRFFFWKTEADFWKDAINCTAKVVRTVLCAASSYAHPISRTRPHRNIRNSYFVIQGDCARLPGRIYE